MCLIKDDLSGSGIVTLQAGLQPEALASPTFWSHLFVQQAEGLI